MAIKHHGAWLATWYDEHGKRHRRACDSKAQAQTLEAAEKRKAERKKARARHRSARSARPGRKRTRARVVCRELAEAAGHIEPWKLTEVIPRALLDRWKRTRARGTAHLYGRILKTLLHHLTILGSTVHPNSLGKLPTQKPRTSTIEREELLRLYAVAPDHLRLFLMLTAETALRAGEALALKPANLDTTANLITITSTKTGEPKTLPVSAEAAALIERARQIDPHGACILALTKGKMTSPESIRTAWNRLKKRAGVRADVRPHDLRRTAAVELYRKTKDIVAVQKLLGHHNAASTLWYLAPYDPANLAPLLDRIHHPERFNPKPN